MSKRLFQVLAVALPTIAVLWALYSPKQPKGDESKYQQWMKPMKSYSTLVSVERYLPTSLSRYLQLPALEQRYLDKHLEICEALLVSGYLTNVEIAVTNATASQMQIVARLNKVSQRNHAKWEFSVRSNAVVVLTCRPQDVALCTRAIENK